MASFASTGDLQNNLHKLASLLRRIKYPLPPDPYSLSKGDPVALLPILHHILLDRSPLLARHFAARGHMLSGKTDARFVDGVYRLLRDEFAFRPAVNKAQFLATGFAERKCIFVHEVVRLCDELERDLRRFGNGENGGGKPKPKAVAAAATASVVPGLHQQPINHRSTPTTATISTQKQRSHLRATAPLAAAAAAPPLLDSSPKVQAMLPNNVAVVTTANRSMGESFGFRMSTRSSARSRSHTSPSSFLQSTNHQNDKHADELTNNADLSWTHSSAAASSSSSSPRSRHAFGASMLCDDHDNAVSRASATAVNGPGEGYTIYEPRKDPPRPPAQMPPELLNPDVHNNYDQQNLDDDDDSINALSFLTTSDMLRSTPRPPHKDQPVVAVNQTETAATATSAGRSSPPPFQFLSRTWVAPTAPPANSTPIPPHPPATLAPSQTVADGPLPLSAATQHAMPPLAPTSVLQAQDAMQPMFENFMRLFAAKEQETNELRARISALEDRLARPPPPELVPQPTPPPAPPRAPTQQEPQQDAIPHPHAPSPPSPPPQAPSSASVSFRASVSTSQPTRFRDQHSRPSADEAIRAVQERMRATRLFLKDRATAKASRCA
ncbi:Centrosomal spindle body, CEP44-domain-containing protein [Geranomyces variabilis]|nr:Centrosomal spindle body, CEP44-domain-containing protein [Geranomyces variabilis]KAJ3138289.1 Centrosomal protein of 44 kDa [Geranomyces variabilis]